MPPPMSQTAPPRAWAGWAVRPVQPHGAPSPAPPPWPRPSAARPSRPRATLPTPATSCAPRRLAPAESSSRPTRRRRSRRRSTRRCPCRPCPRSCVLAAGARPRWRRPGPWPRPAAVATRAWRVPPAGGGATHRPADPRPRRPPPPDGLLHTPRAARASAPVAPAQCLTACPPRSGPAAMAPVNRVTARPRAPPSPPGAAHACRKGSRAAPRRARRSCRGQSRGRRPPPWPVPRVARVPLAQAPRAAHGRVRASPVRRACLRRPPCAWGRSPPAPRTGAAAPRRRGIRRQNRRCRPACSGAPRAARPVT
eukprot:458738-Pleurochrysis_carterae.AAC.1